MAGARASLDGRGAGFRMGKRFLRGAKSVARLAFPLAGGFAFIDLGARGRERRRAK